MPAGTDGASSARKESSHSPPSANAPRAIQHGLTAVQIRRPASASDAARHQASTCQTLPTSTSYRRNTSTRAGHGAGTRAMPMAWFCSDVRSA